MTDIQLMQLTWVDHAANLMAYGVSSGSIDDFIEYHGKKLPVRIWPMPRWTFTHRLAPMILRHMPLQAVTPTHVLRVDGVPVKGSTFLDVGQLMLADTGQPTFSPATAFHITDFFEQGEGVILLDVLLALPKLIEAHEVEIRKLHGEEIQNA